jgi:hypothetical protein
VARFTYLVGYDPRLISSWGPDVSVDPAACILKVFGRTIGYWAVGFVAMYRERFTSYEAVISMDTAMRTSNLAEILLLIVL